MRLEDVTFVAVDLETTGLDFKRDEIIAFAGIPMKDMKIRLSEASYLTICPERYRIDGMKYHGISADDLKLSPCFEDVADHILAVLDGILVGYCVEVDYRFLQRYLRKSGRSFSRKTVDIAILERWIIDRHGRRRTGEDLSFDALLKRYGLKEYYRHNAMADAFFSAQIFQIQCMKYNIDSMEKLTEILRVCSADECAIML
ncbi:MAG: 3'-5' exonuclease [Syntrophobacteraceae bacterium]|jgi:DNA polymerase-3 subunit epsilon|nr:3'-5' exonuclease [Syntrophobacteraceae bacterium]